MKTKYKICKLIKCNINTGMFNFKTELEVLECLGTYDTEIQVDGILTKLLENTNDEYTVLTFYSK